MTHREVPDAATLINPTRTAPAIIVITIREAEVEAQELLLEAVTSRVTVPTTPSIREVTRKIKVAP